MITNIGNIPVVFENQNKIAIIDLSLENPRFFSYTKINELIDRVRSFLLIKIKDRNETIGIISDNSVESISIFFGIVKQGFKAVLINKKFSESQINDIVKENNINVVFSDSILNLSCNVILIDNTIFDLNPSTSQTYENQEFAFILYTSGSSGKPKSIKISHSSHIWNIDRVSSYDSWSNKRISLIMSPIYHSSGLTTLEGSLYGGSTVVLLPKFNQEHFFDAIKKYKINTIFAVPSMLSMAIKKYNDQDVSSVITIRTASEMLSDSLINKIKKVFKNSKILNSYGCTELGPGLFGPHPTGLTRPEKSVGYPVKNIEYKLIDDILYVKTPGAMNSDTDWICTGDRFSIDQNGFYYFIGRSDDMFKSGGNKVYPHEVESIINQYESVEESVVVPLEDELKGYKPYAFVILKNNHSFNEEKLKEYFLSKGPAYLLPRKVWIVDQFPISKTNKIDRKKLKEIASYKLTNGL